MGTPADEAPPAHDGHAGSRPIVTMSQEARRLAEVQTTEVVRGPARVKLNMVGMVFEDETRVASLTSRVDGRLDSVYVDFVGLHVEKGDPIVKIWSPTLIRTQVELFETERSPVYDEDVVQGAVEKLKQFGLTEEQVNKIREEKESVLYVTLRAPISGVVTKKNVFLGDFVKEGTVMYEITDLSKVWVKLDAYETDLPWVRYGQHVTFTTPAAPGRTFSGHVVFIDPMLHMSTRTVKLRVEADNPDLQLKPHMFVSATLEATINAEGQVIRPEWVGKYICPVHPTKVFDEPTRCPRSKQLAKPPQAYGYAASEEPVFPLVIPESAILYTGRRSIVYVEVPDTAQPTYVMREVVLGPRAGRHYVVSHGLREGERVVTKGNFEIDSSAQIAGKPSMMNPQGGMATGGHAHH
jgi:Cu(I)/Ag(I) efflux system membrane fusion protein